MSAAEILEKLKKWVAATDVYRLILGQNIYNLNSRGHCYDRLALIYDFHIKDKAEVCQFIKYNPWLCVCEREKSIVWSGINKTKV